VPRRILRTLGGKILFIAIVLLGIARMIEEIIGDVTQINGPNLGPAFLRSVFVAMPLVALVRSHFDTKPNI